jgi:hypothetical protein
MDPRLERYKRMQQWRGARERDVEIATSVKSFAKETSRLAKALADVAEAFEAVVPPEVAAHCTLVGLKAGTLTVEMASDGARFQLDRFLRQGGEAALRERSAGANVKLAKVRVVTHHERS